MHIITMLLLLSVLILVHELGHFGVARALGIKAERFGFGLPFGPTLYEKKWGDTIVCVHAFLLGGYVSFPDDNPDSEIPKDDIRRISNRPVWQRALVVSAGVTANALIAYLIVLMVAGFSGKLPAGEYELYSAGLQPDKTFTSHTIGIKENDKIVETNGTKIDSPLKFKTIAQRSRQFDNYASQNKINSQIGLIKKLNPSLTIATDKPIPVNTRIKLPQPTNEAPIILPEDYYLNINNYTPSGVELSKAQQELRNSLENTNIYTSNGIMTLADIAAATADTVHPMSIVVERNGEKITLKQAYPNKEGMIGIKLKVEEIAVPVTGFISAITSSWGYLYQNTALMVGGLVKLFTGGISYTELHGIVAITKIGSDIIQHRGIWDGLLLTALISMDLAIINLLPIPALDGGHLIFLLIEKIIGRPVKQETQEQFAKYGFLFLIGLMLFIIFNDIFALLTDKI